jgi:hypothetical protein
MDRYEAQQAQEEGRFVIASGVALLPVPLVWQFAVRNIIAEILPSVSRIQPCRPGAKIP